MRAITPILLIFVLSSCFPLSLLNYPGLNVSSVITNGTATPAEATTAEVRVYITGQAPIHDEIGVIQIVPDGPYYDELDMIVDAAKVEAQKMGANCLILYQERIMNRSMGDCDNQSQVVGYTKYRFIAGVLGS